MSVSALERWYASQCDDNWEHSYGIRIDTLDNPGWRIAFASGVEGAYAYW